MARSIREVARRRNSTSGQVSKSIQGLERLIGTKLFRRSVAGVLLTSQGTEFRSIAQDLLRHGEKIEGLVTGRRKGGFSKVLAIAGTSFLNTYFVTPTVCDFMQESEATTIRFLDVAPDQTVPVGLRGGFEMAVHFGLLPWPGTWVSTRLGKIRWTLTARADHPLSRTASLNQILEYPFVVPTYWTTEGLVRGNDQFPVPISKRKAGYETATADAAVPIVMSTQHIAFLPDLLVRSNIQMKRLKEIRGDKFSAVEKELFLSAKSDAVPAKIYEGLAAAMQSVLRKG
jgi:DNA-binding transcriptional LysR family regulator